MANAFKDKITKDKISFSKKSYLKNNDNWHTVDGTITYGNTITMNSDSRCTITKNFDNVRADYIKFKMRVNADDTSLSTDNGHAVVGLIVATMLDDDDKTFTKQFHFYPKYIFEDSFIDDYTIIQLGNDQVIKKLKIDMINKEGETIKIMSTNLQLSKVINEETVSDISKEEVVNSLEDQVYVDALVDTLSDDDNFNEFLDNRPLVIPLVDVLPDINDVPDGYICRLSTVG